MDGDRVRYLCPECGTFLVEATLSSSLKLPCRNCGTQVTIEPASRITFEPKAQRSNRLTVDTPAGRLQTS